MNPPSVLNAAETSADHSKNGLGLDRYLPVPKNGALCPISGFGHTRFYQKVLNGEGRKYVRIVDLKAPGETRGTKFYHGGDLLAWMNSIATRGSESSPCGRTEGRAA